MGISLANNSGSPLGRGFGEIWRLERFALFQNTVKVTFSRRTLGYGKRLNGAEGSGNHWRILRGMMSFIYYKRSL